ncbi:MAG: transglutaminase domain-containing protein [Flavobacterium sp.]
MKKIIIFICLTTFISYAQKRELGKVTVEELKEKVCPADSSAAAAFLFNIGEVRFEYVDGRGFIMKTRVRSKIKIYKKEAYELANKSVRYYIGGNVKERLNFKDAATYNLVDGKVEKSKLKSDGEFDEKLNKFWGSKKIALPNVKEGSIIEFEYNLESDGLGSLENWTFQMGIPVFYSEFKTVIPEYFKYKPLMRGFLIPKYETSKSTKTVNIAGKEKSDGRVTVTTFTNNQFNYDEVTSIYTLENISALKDESFVNNIKNFTSSIEHELTTIQYPNEHIRNLSTSWEAVAKTIYESDNFGPELNKTGYFEEDINAQLSGLNSSQEKIAAIFNYVKSRMNWNEFYGYSCTDGVKKAYQDKVGNVAEINLMLTAMLRYAGFEANPIVLSSRGNGISLFPSRTSFDYVISGIESNGQIILFDATSKYALPNVLPIRDLNWFGRLIRKDGSSEQVDLMPKSNSKEIINVIGEISNEGKVSGKLRDQYLDYNAFNYRERYNNVNKESMVERIEKSHPGLEISEFEVQNTNDLSKPIIENYAFDLDNAIEIIGDKMYLSPLLFFTMNENPFKQEKREYPIDFIFPHQDKYNVSLKLPEGYVVESLPQSKVISMPEDMANFKFNLSNSGDQLQMVCSLDINRAVIGSEYYETLKSFFKEVINKQTEKVVLKKG